MSASEVQWENVEAGQLYRLAELETLIGACQYVPHYVFV